MKNLSLVLIAALFFVILLPSHSSAAAGTELVTTDNTSIPVSDNATVVETKEPSAQASVLTIKTFRYDFSNYMYTDIFHAYYALDITVDLTSESTYPGDDATFSVALEKCTRSAVGICSWSTVGTTSVKADGVSSVRFPGGGGAPGDYRIKLYNIRPSGYSVTGYGQYTFY